MFRMLDLVQTNISKSSVDESQQGVQAGPKMTATESLQMREAALQLLSLFLRFMEWGIEDKAKIRIENILQFYGYPVDINGKKEMRQFRIDNVPLVMLNGMGSIFIKFVKDRKSLPIVPARTFEQEAKMKDLYGPDFDEIVIIPDEDSKSETVYITPDYVRTFDIGVQVIADSSVKVSESLLKMQEVEWFRMMAGNPMVNQEKLLKDLTDVYDKNADEVIVKKEEMQAEQAPEAQMMKAQATQAGAPARGMTAPQRPTAKQLISDTTNLPPQA